MYLHKQDAAGSFPDKDIKSGPERLEAWLISKSNNSINNNLYTHLEKCWYLTKHNSCSF